MGVCGNVCRVAAIVKDWVFVCFGLLKYVFCLCKGCCVFCLYYNTWSCMCSRAGLMATYKAASVSFCLPHPVDVSAFIMCSGLCACTEML